MVRLDAQVGVGIARVRFGDDKTFDDHRFLLVVVCGGRGLVKVRLREIVTERAQNRGEREDKDPARFWRAPPDDDAEQRHTHSNAKCNCRHRDARRKPNADEPDNSEGDEGRCHASILSPIGANSNTPEWAECDDRPRAWGQGGSPSAGQQNKRQLFEWTAVQSQ